MIVDLVEGVSKEQRETSRVSMTAVGSWTTVYFCSFEPFPAPPLAKFCTVLRELLLCSTRFWYCFYVRTVSKLVFVTVGWSLRYSPAISVKYVALKRKSPNHTKILPARLFKGIHPHATERRNSQDENCKARLIKEPRHEKTLWCSSLRSYYDFVYCSTQ